MPVHDDLGIRMKTYYEQIPQTKLIRRTPVAIRIDGKAFHTYTKGFDKPFDKLLINTMQETMRYLCENIQGCVLGYTQSDEITLILQDYKSLNTAAWFDYEVQKICSISASMATAVFNKYISSVLSEIIANLGDKSLVYGDDIAYDKLKTYQRAFNQGAMFDARCFNIPKEEVTNLIYWRQLDAIRNSIQMVGQAYFSHKELQNKSCNDIRQMLIAQKNISWDDFPTCQKRGSCCIKETYSHVETTYQYMQYPEFLIAPRTRWKIDNEIPIFKGDGREYIEKLINFGE